MVLHQLPVGCAEAEILAVVTSSGASESLAEEEANQLACTPC